MRRRRNFKREEFMRRLLAILGVATLAACGTSNDNSSAVKDSTPRQECTPTVEWRGELSDEDFPAAQASAEWRGELSDEDFPAAQASAEWRGELSDEDFPAAQASAEWRGELSDEDFPAAQASAEWRGELSDEDFPAAQASAEWKEPSPEAKPPKPGCVD